MDILDLLKRLDEKDEKLRSVFDCDFLGHILDDLWNMILFGYNIPRDNTEEMAEKYNNDLDKALEDKDFYCRDYLYDLQSDFCSGKISKAELIKELEKAKL